MKIAILHPQCRIQGGAIKMALLSTRLLAEAGHDTTLYTFTHSPECFSDLQKNIKIEIHEAAKNTPFSPLKKLISIITLAWRLRHVDTIIANNPPMQIVAALAKVFNRKVHTLWWHHHTPWYIYNNRIKSFFERYLIVPFIDTMIATSHFVGERLKSYSGRDATVIHPVLDKAPQQTNKSNISDNDNNRVLLFTHGRLEPGKGIDTIVRVWEEMKKEHASSLPRRRESRPVSPDLHGPGYPPSRVGQEGDLNSTEGNNIHLTIYGTGSLEKSLKAQGINVQPYDVESTLGDIANSGMSSLAIYASTIDAFGMAPLEAQSTGISTLILDRGGARETLVSDVSGECVGRLVDTESDLCAAARYFIAHKKFPENMSIVNFSHTIDYFTPQRLSSDLLSAINKTRE